MKIIFPYLFIALVILNFSAHSQCPVVPQCFPAPGGGSTSYFFTPIILNSSNTTIIADTNPNDWVGPVVKATNVTCALINNIAQQLDVQINVYIPDSTSGGVANFSTGFNWPSPANGTIGFNGDYYKNYIFVTRFFKTGTTTPVNINVMQQITDIDGEGDWNGDNNKDDSRATSFTKNLVNDDYAWSTGFTAFDTNTVTHIYTRVSGINTYFHSSGCNNAGYACSGISGRAASASTQAFVLAFTDKNSTMFGYFSGQFGGVSIDFTMQNIVITQQCAATTALPLNLLSFAGSKQAAYNNIQWKTSAEINTREFLLEQSIDNVQWIGVDKITAKGSGANSYFYNDYSVSTGIKYYRLKMIDNNGTFKYSNVIVIKNSTSDNVLVYPNPAKEIVNINIGKTKLLNTIASLFSLEGKLIKNILISKNLLQVNVNELKNGIYLLKFTDGSVSRFIKVE